ncbi:MAG TPA: ABC transporter permease subunit [Acidocella sp.]|nr:ABC transporter permease subunit [Acidocella sp.]
MIKSILPVIVVAVAAVVLWYGLSALLGTTLLPRPDQVLGALGQSLFGWPLSSPRNLFYHAYVTAQEALLGLALALVLGGIIATLIVHVKVLDRSLMPWVIASQTIPVLAIAPMVVVVLGNLGFSGLAPKVAIAAYLAFFPIVVGLVKGMRAPEAIQFELLHTYCASEASIFSKLRLPASVAFLFPSLRVSAALAVMGAIVAELPTGAQAGLGARLLAGSYYGQSLMVWSTLLAASLLSAVILGAITLLEAGLRLRRGGRL